MEMLSALDATFIYLESEHSPMAIGGLYVIDAKDAPDNFSYETWFALVETRLKLSKVFRERLVEVPWDLSFPYWIRDPGFDLHNHLPHVNLSEPGGMDELMQMAADIWGQVLNRERPLWEITFVEGLDNIPGISNGSFALITKVHHAAVDGKASVELMSALLDMTAILRSMRGRIPGSRKLSHPILMWLHVPGQKPDKKRLIWPVLLAKLLWVPPICRVIRI